MNPEQNAHTLKEELSLHLNALLPLPQCQKLIATYEKEAENGQLESIMHTMIMEYTPQIFSAGLNALLKNYFESDYQIFWINFDVVDSSSTSYFSSTRWHLDYGVAKALKLFIYLNPVSEHGGNTLIIDEERTKQLARAGALPLNGEERREDLTPVLEQLGLDTSHLAYDLEAGGGLLFSPYRLAHKRLVPNGPVKRYTICYTLTPDLGQPCTFILRSERETD